MGALHRAARPVLLGLGLALAFAAPAPAVVTIDIPYTEVVGKYNEGGDCQWYHYFLQINEVSGATSYSALNRYHGGGFTLNYSGPPFPDDDEQGEGYHFVAPPGTHRWGATGGSHPGACTDSVKDEWEPDYVRAHFDDFHMSGVVKEQDGSPAAGVTVRITGPENDTVTTGGDGRYTSRDFTTQGSYTAQVDQRRYCAVGIDPCSRQRSVVLPPNQQVDFVAGGVPEVEAITFREPSGRTGGLVDIGPAGTTDGNQVEITARVRNPEESTRDVTVQFRDPASGLILPGGEQSLTVPAKGTAEARRTVDTTGYAWNDNGTPHPQRDVTVSLANGPSKTVSLGVRPKPAVLVHGVWSSPDTFAAYPGTGFLAAAHGGWRGYAVGDGQFPGELETDPFATYTKTIAENANELTRYINGLREQTNAAHVDIVAHSMGGLISRRYIQDHMTVAADGRPIVSHLVMMGTPHLGSPCAEVVGAVMAADGRWIPPVEELTPSAMADFNRQVTDRKGVRFSGLIGHALSATCHSAIPGDEVVPVPSAGWTLTETSTLSLLHTEMTSAAGAFAFVKGKLALGPAVANARAARATTAHASRRGRVRASATSKPCRTRSAKPVQLQASAVRSLKPAGKAGFKFRVPRSKRLNVVLALPFSVRAVLRDASGKVRGRSEPRSRGADGSTRSLTVRRPRAGVWRLAFAQTAARRANLAAGVVAIGSREKLVATASRRKRALVVSARPVRGKRRVRGLKVTARVAALRGRARGLRLRDTGRGADRKARDGIYTARLRPAPRKDVTIAVKARGKRFSVATVTGSCVPR